MLKRTLGRTNHDSTVVTFGAFSLGYVDQDTADDAMQLVLDHGINHVDIAPGYGHAMERIAHWVPELQQRDIFIGAKTPKRTRDEAWADVDSIMSERMKIDRFDLFQLHSVGTMEELDAAMAPGGALETLIEMREQGLTDWLGVTGHGPDAPATFVEALRRFDFDTVMFPLNPASARDPQYRADADALIGLCLERDVGIQTIKMIARGGWGDGNGKDLNTWYDPHRQQAEIDRSLWWVLSQPMHTAPSCGEISLLPKVIDAAERYVAPLTSDEQSEVVADQSPPFPLPALAIPAAMPA